jgi:hypothetical protein
MATSVKAPTNKELAEFLGPAAALWTDIIRAVEAVIAPMELAWKPSKMEFGRMALLQHKKRTLLYLMPQKRKILVAIVLGARAYGQATASALPAAIKTLLAEAKPYAEGRGIRFPVSSARDIPAITKLVEIKIAPAQS